mgnify:CR=1 FL=1
MTTSEPVALITGASAGIGLALARRYAARGHRLALLARRVDRLEALAGELGTDRAKAFPCDVAKGSDVEEAVRAARDAFGRIDVVIANAGIAVSGLVERLEEEAIRRQLETNVFGVVRTVRAALPALKETRGRIGIVGSVNGFLATAAWSPYVMSKYAVRGFAECLRQELRPYGVSVTHLAPGFVESEIRTLREGQAPVPDPVPRWIVMPSAKAAAQMERAVTARKRERVITGHGKAAVFLERHAPGLVATVMNFATARLAKDGAGWG